MKNKLFLCILIGILAVFTLGLIGCGDDENEDIIGSVSGGEGYDAVFCILADTEVADTDNDVLRLINIDGQTFDSAEGLEFTVASDNNCIEPTGTNGVLKSKDIDEDAVTYLTATSGGKSFVIKVVVFAEYNPSEYAVTYADNNDVIIPYGVTSIATEFSVSGIKTVRIPSTVKEIGEKAFLKCKNLTKVTMSKNVESIGKAAFQNCVALTRINLPSTLTAIETNAFRKCSSLVSIKLPDSVTTIGKYAFCGCSSLEEITMPATLSELGGYVFQNCESLKTIVIPEGVTEIGEWSFSNCYGLESVTFPSTLTTIGSKSFMDCKNLKELVIPDSVTAIGDSAFRGCRKIASISIPANLLPEANAFTGVSGITSVTLTGKGQGVDYTSSNYSRTAWYNSKSNAITVKVSEGITSIGEYTFVKITGLKSVELPSTLKQIKHGAFRKCNNLTSVTIPEGVTYIGLHAFSLCQNLETVEFPSTLKEIGPWAFAYCCKLQSVSLGNEVEKIDYNAFTGCNGLTSIQLGKDSGSKLTTIGEQAFRGLLYNCKSVKIASTKLETVGEGAFGFDQMVLNMPSYGVLADGSTITVASKSMAKKFSSNFNYNPNTTTIKVKGGADKSED